jgi:ABC-type lipoprotein release transport system permease subunit
LLQTLLFNVSAGDPLTIAIVSAGIATAAIVASLPPALRASRVDPVVALRED